MAKVVVVVESAVWRWWGSRDSRRMFDTLYGVDNFSCHDFHVRQCYTRDRITLRNAPKKRAPHPSLFFLFFQTTQQKEMKGDRSLVKALMTGVRWHGDDASHQKWTTHSTTVCVCVFASRCAVEFGQNQIFTRWRRPLAFVRIFVQRHAFPFSPFGWRHERCSRNSDDAAIRSVVPAVVCGIPEEEEEDPHRPLGAAVRAVYLFLF